MQSLDHHTSLMQQPLLYGRWRLYDAGGCERETGALFPYAPPWTTGRRLLVGFHSGGTPPF